MVLFAVTLLSNQVEALLFQMFKQVCIRFLCLVWGSFSIVQVCETTTRSKCAYICFACLYVSSSTEWTVQLNWGHNSKCFWCCFAGLLQPMAGTSWMFANVLKGQRFKFHTFADHHFFDGCSVDLNIVVFSQTMAIVTPVSNRWPKLNIPSQSTAILAKSNKQKNSKV